MKSQICKNKEKLWECIEVYSNKPIDLDNARRLNEYMGAYNALCMICGEKESEHAALAQSEEHTEPTPELDGDTEFERIIMTIPADQAHMVKLTHIFNKHMEGLAAVNIRAYNSIMEQLREVANS